MKKNSLKSIDVISPSLGRRFSGINASMHTVIPEQTKLTNIAGLGFNLHKDKIPVISFNNFLFGCWRDKWRIWHARRNVDMVVGIIFRYVFRYKIKLLFTSASQRQHSWFTKFCYHKMDAVIATTKSGGEFLECEYDVVYHGVNTDKFFPRVKNIKQKKIGFINRIRKQKGAEDFVEAMIKVFSSNPNSDWIAELYGETTPKHKEFEEKLKSKIKAANLEDKIVFKGFVEFNSIPDIYRTCDVVVCLSHVEGFGLPCLEAMASRAAVVATRTGVWKEIIKQGENGYLVDAESPDQVAEKLETLITNDSLREKIAQNGYELVTSKYKIENEAQGIQKVYDRLLNQKNAK
ncbi:glycosyl transferase family 1 [Candidatus Francisella endociliophora]|uniref:Glycosyl transferase family 1 n=1 Tax=Candidatus Francisella endociliophora TaxID=653937 RepID=A0A097ERR7_9GAMM|nr:glycosyltransferase family 4 protein [Francisella sp. FSC1006]AIT10268.1 glycosyl transferase family 1 [Francisella sp. FSC1006]